MGQIMSILVEYKNVDGWHVFSSDEMAGLYIASEKAETAYNDVSTAIEKLMMLNSGIECKVTPELSYFEFVRRARASQAKSESEPAEQSPLALGSQRYAVCPAAQAHAA